MFSSLFLSFLTLHLLCIFPVSKGGGFEEVMVWRCHGREDGLVQKEQLHLLHAFWMHYKKALMEAKRGIVELNANVSGKIWLNLSRRNYKSRRNGRSFHLLTHTQSRKLKTRKASAEVLISSFCFHSCAGWTYRLAHTRVERQSYFKCMIDRRWAMYEWLSSTSDPTIAAQTERHTSKFKLWITYSYL